jgi:hypothetical protein
MLDPSERVLLHGLWIGTAAAVLGLAGVAFAASIAVFPVDPDFRPNALWQWGLYAALVVPAAAILCIRTITMATRSYRDAWELMMDEVDRAANGEARPVSRRRS